MLFMVAALAACNSSTDKVGPDGRSTATDPTDTDAPPPDRDGDGIPDHEDICPDDALDDSDGDGICDSDDLCDG